MRANSLVALFGLLLSTELAAQAPAAGQQPAPTPPQMVASFDAIGRGTFFSSGSDEGRFQKYRDLRSGATLELFRYSSADEFRQFGLQADHVGYRDQRYGGTYNRFGRVRASVEWNQIPLFFSNRTATLFSAEAPGVLRISDAIQSGVQNRTSTLASAVSQAQPFDLRTRRDVFDFRLSYNVASNLDLDAAVKSTDRSGSQPWAGSFGFSNTVELAVPIDTRTTEVGTSLEWSNDRGLVRAGYDGSFFRNDVGTLVWDNPVRIGDSPTAGPLQGRMALWPNSNLNAANATGMVRLPRRSQATAYVSVGRWTQDEPLIPFSVNTALAPLPLDRATTDAEALVTAMTYAFSSRPGDRVWVSARYRSYDFDNRTPVFDVARTVAYDTRVAEFGHGGTSPYSFKRQVFDVDGSFTPVPFTAFRVGYTLQQVDQTFRFFDETTEHTVRASVDTTRLGWLTIRGAYEHGHRVGAGLDEQTLDDVGEQTSLRQFDIANRDSDRFSAIVQVAPLDMLSFNGTVTAGREDRPDGVFGLRSNDSRGYSLGVDFIPRDAVSLGVSYTFEKYTALQRSRQADPGPDFDNPRRDWTTDSADRAHTVTAGLDLLKLWPRVDLRFAYDLSRARSVYIYRLAPNSTLNPVVQLPAVVNELQRGTADVRYEVGGGLAAGFAYWYDRYSVDDFALGQETLAGLAQPSFLTIGYLYRPYTAQTLIGRLIYLW